MNILDKIKHNFDYFLILLFFVVLPFERLLTLEVSGFTLKMSYVLALIIILLFVYRSLKGKVKLKIEKNEIFLILFSVWSYLTIFWSIDPKRSLIVSLLFSFVFALYFVLRRVIKRDHMTIILKIIVWLGVATAIFSFWQFITDSMGFSQNISTLRNYYTKQIFGFPRVQATFLEPLYFANFLIVPLFVASYFFIKKTTIKNALPIIIMSVSLFLTMSRGAIFGAIFGFILLCITLIVLKKQYLKTAILCVSLLLSFGLAMMAINFSSKTGVNDYLNHATENEIADSLTGNVSSVDLTNRNYTIPLAIEKAKNNYFGIGAGAFGALPEFAPLRANGSYQTVNNLYLEVLVEQGMVGFLLLSIFVILTLLPLVKSIKDKNILNICLLFAFVSIFVQFISMSTLYIIYIWAFLALIKSEPADEES